MKAAKELGTVPFSAMARIAFISSALLRSLKDNGVLTNEFIENFMGSIQSPLSEIQSDLELYTNRKMTKTDFLKKYGHLRPGTYDITALRYDKNKKFFENVKHLTKVNRKPLHVDNSEVNRILLANGLRFNTVNFFEFVKESLVQRERLKFEFTKNLSDALELIVDWGQRLGFSRRELANLTIKDILNTKNLSKSELIRNLKNKIVINSKVKEISNYLLLPPLIFSEIDFKIITHYVAKPNYITNKTTTGNLVRLDSSEKIPKLSNSIIMIENADPGYDWIFTKNPAGLITKYGGVASHMAIRCAEFGMPAAIGCGDIIFERLQFAKKVMIDCKNEQIIILQHDKKDDYVEEKKILKSLGYIK